MVRLRLGGTRANNQVVAGINHLQQAGDVVRIMLAIPVRIRILKGLFRRKGGYD